MKRAQRIALCGMVVAGALIGVTLRGHSAPVTPRTAAAKAKSAFYLKDGDRVVFYGDSITDQRLYTTYIESYCQSRFPKKHFTFIHSGWGGDRVTGGGGGPIDLRLKRDVLAYKPTVVTICLGMNDGSYRAFDQNIFNTYLNGYRHILDTLKKELPGVRITLLTAPAFDDVTRPANFPGGYNATLIAYGEAVKRLGEEYGLRVADTNAPLVAALAEAQASQPTLASKIIADRVHPGPGGHIVMAGAVLNAWNAPDTVANIALDGKTGQVLTQDNTRLSQVQTGSDKITFTHTDNALPWPLDRDPNSNQDSALTLAVTDLETQFNRYTLRVTGLTGEYTIKADGQEVGKVSGEDLGRGVDLAALPNFPVNVQAREVLGLIRKHNDLHFQRWRAVQVPAAKDSLEVPADAKQKMDALDKQEADTLAQLRTAVQPKPHTVEISAAR